MREGTFVCVCQGLVENKENKLNKAKLVGHDEPAGDGHVASGHQPHLGTWILYEVPSVTSFQKE
jgi:hypothetical protein